MSRDTNEREKAVYYELPQGVAVQQNGEEKTFRVLPSRTPGLVFIHLQVNTEDRRKYYQTIEMDVDNAEMLAEKMQEAVDLVKKQLPGNIQNGYDSAERD